MRKFLSLLLLLCSVACVAQYNTTGTYSTFNTLGGCVSNNCFLQTSTNVSGTNVSLTQTSTGYDFYVVGLDSNGAPWNLPTVARTKSLWSPLTALGSGLKYVAVRTKNEIYALIPDSSCGQSGNFLPEVWNGSVWRKLLGKCVLEISITPDGTLIGVGKGTLISYTTDPYDNVPTWTPGANNSSGWSHVVGVNSTAAYAIKSNTLYQLNLTNGTFPAVSGAPAATNLAYTDDGYIFLVAATPGPNGNIYYDNVNAPAWVNLKGTVPAISGGASNGMFGLNSGLPYHLLATGLSITSVVQGSWVCPPNGCPIGSYHTATAHAHFGNDTGTQGQISGYPSSTLNARAQDYSYTCDPIFGDPQSSACSGQAAGDVQCSVMGNIYNGGGAPGWTVEVAYTMEEQFGVQYPGTVLNGYYAAAYCSTSNPDFNISPVYEINALHPHPWGWLMNSVCFSPTGGQPWSCSGAVGQYEFDTPQLPYACTSNP